MKPCIDYEQELAACAALSGVLSTATARHLEQCDRCRAAFADLQDVAAIHIHAAAKLPIPTAGPQLDSWFANALAQRPTKTDVPSTFAGFRRRPVVFCGSALLLIAALFLVFRESQDTKPADPPLAHLPPSPVERAAVALDPTWQAFRRELDNDPSEDRTYRRLGAVVSHYRLKDAYLEAN